jgi:hypothetical protein
MVRSVRQPQTAKRSEVPTIITHSRPCLPCFQPVPGAVVCTATERREAWGVLEPRLGGIVNLA